MDYMELLGDSLSRISNSNAEKIFLVGDFNLPDFDWINQLPLSLDQLYVNSFEIFNDAFLTQVRLPHKWRAQSIYRQHLLRLEIYIFWRSKGSIIGPICLLSTLMILDQTYLLKLYYPFMPMMQNTAELYEVN